MAKALQYLKYASKMQMHHERVLEIGILWDWLTITPFYRNDLYIFCVLGETTFTFFYLYINDSALNKRQLFMRTGFLPLPLQRLQVLTAEVREKML